MSGTLLGLVLALLPAEDRAQLIQGTSSSRSDHLELHGGGVVVREGEAGSAFGTFQAGKQKRQLTYFVVFKHRLSAVASTEFSEETRVDDLTGQSKQNLSVDGKTLEIEYKIDLEAASKKVSKETLTLNRKATDLARGRVFLVDLTVSPPRWQQRKVELPAEVAEATSKKAAEELVRKVMAALVKEDAKVKEFVEEAGK